MAQDTGEELSETTWSIPKFSFTIKAGDSKIMSCQEVSGLDTGE